MMATIDNLNKSISEMTDAELRERIREIRHSRRTTPTKPKLVRKSTKPKGAVATSRKQEKTPEELLSTMNAEQKAEFLKRLQALGGLPNDCDE